MRRPLLHRTGERQWPLRFRIAYNKVPVKLDYNVVVIANGRERNLTNWRADTRFGGGGSFAGSVIDFPPLAQATSFDIVYRPNPNWEISSRDSTPPWGGELVFRKLKLGEGSVDADPPGWRSLTIGGATRSATTRPAWTPALPPVPF